MIRLGFEFVCDNRRQPRLFSFLGKKSEDVSLHGERGLQAAGNQLPFFPARSWDMIVSWGTRLLVTGSLPPLPGQFSHPCLVPGNQ